MYADDIQVYVQVLLENLLEGIAHLSRIAEKWHYGLTKTICDLTQTTAKTTAIAFDSFHAMGIFEQAQGTRSMNHPTEW